MALWEIFSCLPSIDQLIQDSQLPPTSSCLSAFGWRMIEHLSLASPSPNLAAIGGWVEVQ